MWIQSASGQVLAAQQLYGCIHLLDVIKLMKNYPCKSNSGSKPDDLGAEVQKEDGTRFQKTWYLKSSAIKINSMSELTIYLADRSLTFAFHCAETPVLVLNYGCRYQIAWPVLLKDCPIEALIEHVDYF
ncbi:hypothetical protein OUZ56_020929 [Daphnia magna]|uniref:Uncharacterized protein n=1 Tax=Daphnia magna TaxID=35525 RepID=A0ABQ9ZFV5_9CRUS|nr:hypothetical protein OUZ56_020929 [Daphnia magna]